MSKKYNEHLAKKKWNIDIRPVKSDSDMNLILDTLEHNFKYGKRNKMIWQLGVVTMLRISDLLNLKKMDIVEETGNLKLNTTIYEQKTGKKREIYLKSLYIELSEYIKTVDSEWMFPNSKNDGHLSDHTYYLILNKVSNLTGVKGIGTHSMRKSGAYRIYNETGNVALVQKRLNHGSQSITLRYLEIDLKEQQEVIDSIDFFNN